MAPRLATLIKWPSDNQKFYQLQRWALLHDSLEGVTGDIPTPLKKRMADLKSAENDLLAHTHQEFAKMAKLIEGGEAPWDDIRTIVKFCDSVEAVQFLIDETMLGNLSVRPILATICARIDQEYNGLPWGPSVTAQQMDEIWDGEISPLINYMAMREWPTVE